MCENHSIRPNALNHPKIKILWVAKPSLKWIQMVYGWVKHINAKIQ